MKERVSGFEVILKDGGIIFVGVRNKEEALRLVGGSSNVKSMTPISKKEAQKRGLI